MTYIKEAVDQGGDASLPSFIVQGRPMNFQKLFEKNENSAVIIGVIVFAIFHFGMLFLFDIV